MISEVPELFSRAIACAMAKDRADRYRTVREFAGDLRAVLGDTPINYSPATHEDSADGSNAPTLTGPTLFKETNHKDTKDTKIF
jgi:hypothetical protein